MSTTKKNSPVIKVKHGDLVSFRLPDYEIEFQGLVVCTYSEHSIKYSVCALCARPADPHDYIKEGKHYIFEYYQTCEYVTIPNTDILKRLNGGVFDEEGLTIESIKTEVKASLLRKGFIYFSGFKDYDTLWDAVPIDTFISIYNFQPSNISTIMDTPDDVPIALFEVFREVIFAPFINPETSPKERSTNCMALWVLLIEAAKNHATLNDIKRAAMEHPKARRHPKASLFQDWSLLDIQKLIKPTFTISFVMERLVELLETTENLHKADETFIWKPNEIMSLIEKWKQDVELQLKEYHMNPGKFVDPIEQKHETPATVAPDAEIFKADRAFIDNTQYEEQPDVLMYADIPQKPNDLKKTHQKESKTETIVQDEDDNLPSDEDTATESDSDESISDEEDDDDDDEEEEDDDEADE